MRKRGQAHGRPGLVRVGLLGQEVAEKDMGSRTRAGWENMPRWKNEKPRSCWFA